MTHHYLIIVGCMWGRRFKTHWYVYLAESMCAFSLSHIPPVGCEWEGISQPSATGTPATLNFSPALHPSNVAPGLAIGTSLYSQLLFNWGLNFKEPGGLDFILWNARILIRPTWFFGDLGWDDIFKLRYSQIY